MTRIFDALKKVQAVRPEPAPPAPVAPAISAPPMSPALSPAPMPRARGWGRATGPGASAPGPRANIVPAEHAPELSEEILREMGRLRVNLESALTERVPRVVMLVSTQGGEGTTTVASQLALALATEKGLRVLLADLHAARPGISPDLKPARTRHPRSDHGAEVTMREAPAAHAGRLWVLPLDRAHPESVTPQAAREMLDALSADFDWVILDGPPALESPESAPLCAIADGVIVIVQAGRTKRPVLSRSVELLRKAGARVLGTVLNRRRLEIPGFIYRRI
jgi:Mrp family chromosome partitioning ATPase